MSGPHLSSEQLDLLELGALSPEVRSRLEEHMVGCRRCERLRTELREAVAHFDQVVHPRTADRLLTRVEPPPRSARDSLGRLLQRARRRGDVARPSIRWGLPGLVAAALVAALWVFTPGAENPGRPYLAARGSATFQAIVARGEGRSELQPGAVLRKGDRLRFRVDPGAARYVMVLSRDGAGTWTVYAPFGGDRSVAVEPGTSVLGGAVELDGTPGTEHLLAVFSDAPLEVETVLRAARARPWRSSEPSELQPNELRISGARSVRTLTFEKR